MSIAFTSQISLRVINQQRQEWSCCPSIERAGEHNTVLYKSSLLYDDKPCQDCIAVVEEVYVDMCRVYVDVYFVLLPNAPSQKYFAISSLLFTLEKIPVVCSSEMLCMNVGVMHNGD
ncbi:hypothetical protein Tco_1133819 [Tanacetum coccineum]